MKRSWAVSCLFAGLLGLSPSLSHADEFVILVGTNRSLDLSRPVLQYADDDAFRYLQLFRALLPGVRTFLLAEPDRDTAATLPELAGEARSPTKAALWSTIKAVASGIAAARAAGRRSTVYFTYAGHGDVERGKGFVQLADQRLWSDDLEKMITSLGADRVHLIVDSCNSFFLLNPRRPGGRQWATPLDAAASFVGRHGNVGALLSTSAEQTVYEWSQIQSGIFSHIVRSGLTGGADANGDGRVSYTEFAGFIQVASSGVPNSAVRPRLFARPPGGDPDEVFIDLRRSSTHTLLIDGAPVSTPARRLLLRDRQGARLADLNAEPGYAVTLRLWGQGPLSIEVEQPPPHRPREYELPPGRSVVLSELAPPRVGPLSRGQDLMFQQLFAQPFGPRALAAYLVEAAAAPTPAYGMRPADRSRVELQLRLLSRAEQDERWTYGLAQATTGSLVAISGLGLWLQPRDSATCDRECAVVGGISVATGGALLARAIWNFRRRSASERLEVEIGDRLEAGDDPTDTLAYADRRLDQIALAKRRSRRVFAWGAGVLLGASTLANLAFVIAEPEDRLVTALSVGSMATLAIGVPMILMRESAAERQIRVFRTEPLLQEGIGLAIAPLPGGAAFSLAARY